MKQLEVTQKTIGEAMFYIKPFPAFTAANISGELVSTLGPLLGGTLGAVAGSRNAGNIMDMDVEEALPSISTAFAGLSGDKFERLMKKLLIDSQNISVAAQATNGEVKVMDLDIANEVFCGEVQDMYILCFEVIRLNFKGFFKKIGARFGSLQGLLQAVTPTGENTESSTSEGSASSN